MPFITWKIVFKIIIENYFCTKIENLLFDLKEFIFSSFFYWIQMGVFSYLHCKLKVKEKIRVYDFYLNIFNVNKYADRRFVPKVEVQLIKSCGLLSSTGWENNVQPVGQDQWPILVTSTGWEKMFNRLEESSGLIILVQLVGKNMFNQLNLENIEFSFSSLNSRPILDLLTPKSRKKLTWKL